MPAFPVVPTVAGLDGWSLWQKGRISAANVTWSVDAYDVNAQQNYLLSTLAIAKGYNAIRLALTAGSSDAAWDDMLKIANESWSDTMVADSTATTAIQQAPRLSNGMPVATIRAINTGDIIELGVVGQINNILVRCAQRGLGVIFDVHDFYQRDWVDSGTTKVGPLWAGTSASGHSAAYLRTELVTLWTKIVQQWGAANWLQVWQAIPGQESASAADSSWPVIGYEILNEPNPDPSLSFAQMQGTANGKVVDDNNWFNLATRCIQAIRATDSTTPIVIDGIYYADAYGLKYFQEVGLLSDPYIVYSFHAYGPQDFTHQGVTEELYESIGIPYPLTSIPGASSPLLRTSVYDGSSAWVNANGGSTTKAAYVPFSTHSDFLARVQPALDFKAAHSTVPIFVGEFSAVNTALLRSTQVPTTSAHRVITGIGPDTTGQYPGDYVATLGHLTGGFNVNVFPNPGSFAQPPANDPYNGYGGAYSDNVKATITVTTGNNTSFNISDVTVRLPHGQNFIVFVYPSGHQPSGTRLGPSGGGGVSDPQVATLTLAPRYPAAVDASRLAYIKDVLKMCADQQFSWAYWQEDGYVGTPDSLPSGVFIGWRPSTTISQVLTNVANGRAVS